MEELEQAAMQLPPEERERLGLKLLASVDTPLNNVHEWAEETDRRADELLSGKVAAIDGNEVLRVALKRIR